jgi:outer membrane usher protein
MMDRSKRQSRSNKGFLALIAILIASVFFAPITLAKARKPVAGAQETMVVADDAAADPAAAPATDDLPAAGHLNDEPAAPSTSPDDPIPGAGHLNDEPGQAPEAKTPGLQLDVLINGYKIDLVAAFILLPDGSMTSNRSELRELGLKVPGTGADDEQINLAAIESLKFVYDEAAQTIDLQVSDANREAKAISIIPKKEMLPAESDTGFVLNYSGYGAANLDLAGEPAKFSGASINLDARAFSRFGVIQQTGVIGTTTFSEFSPIRLDTNWTYANQDRAENYTIGDVISGGLSWTRPVRMGGAQVQRNFGIRPDLITKPLPSLAGSAAVPSTLDVYINNAKSFSQPIAPGPFTIDRLPVVTSNGTARVVITDTSGRQTQSETQIFTSPDLLAPHLFDYSLDIGLARRGFGTENFAYDSEIMGIASARYGVNDAITAEAHAEGRLDMIEGGFGALFVAGPIGTFNTAASASMYQGELGFMGYASWDIELGSLLVRASTQRTFGKFVDLAAVTELPINGIYRNGVPQALDQVSISYGFSDLNVGTGLSLIHQVTNDGAETMLVGANVTKSFGDKLSVYANAYVDLNNSADYGAFIGLSMPFGKDTNASAGGSYVKGAYAATAEVSKPLDTNFGSYGYRVSASDNQGDARLSAEGSYRAPFAIGTARLANTQGKISGSANIEGSIVASKGGLFLGNPINDSFAIVDAGFEDIDVSYENRFVGKTGKNGKLLISQLHSYQNNKITINPENLPLNSSVTDTEKHVAPRAKSGVLIDFGVKKDGNGVIVILKDANDKFIAPGTAIKVEGKDEPFVMGYDGEVYLTDIGEHVSLMAEGANTSCSATFEFKADATTQTSIGPLQCL